MDLHFVFTVCCMCVVYLWINICGFSSIKGIHKMHFKILSQWEHSFLVPLIHIIKIVQNCKSLHACHFVFHSEKTGRLHHHFKISGDVCGNNLTIVYQIKCFKLWLSKSPTHLQVQNTVSLTKTHYQKLQSFKTT